MVVRHGIQVQLVYADSKILFKEHQKEGKIYVEAEPDAEYYIAIQRIDLDRPPVIVGSICIDGKDLGYNFSIPSASRATFYCGLFSRINGDAQHVALQFTKPSPAQPNKGYTGNTGTITVILYEGKLDGYTRMADFTPSVDLDPTVNTSSITSCKKKFLLSAPGKTSIASYTEHKRVKNYIKGALIGQITLSYCSAVGMIEEGVFPKPDIWALERIKRPARPGQLRATFKKMRHPTEEDKEIEVVDLTDETAPPKFTW
jgi:hypothetical protein